MSTYGITRFGTDLYGLNRPVTVIPGGAAIPTISSAYLIDPFTAVPVDYQTVLLTWSGPDPTTSTPMDEFRLLSNRYGYPVDENDGTVLLDTTSAPGYQYADQNVVPGEIAYYGFYISTGASWVRAGFTSCLMPVYHGYDRVLLGYLPEYLRDVSVGELTAAATGDAYLTQFLQVVGWPLDYLKTQYDFLYDNQNDPMGMSFADLAELAAEIGMPFSPEIPARFLRKAAAGWATVMRQRGSLDGIAEHMSLLSGFGADVQVARNIMLENDQSLPYDPRFRPWSGGIPYKAGEVVSWPVYPAWVSSQSYIVNNYVVYNGANYQCIATGGSGVPPVGATTSGTYWALAAGPYVYVCISPIVSFPGNAPPAVGAAGSTPTGSNANWQLVYDAASRPPWVSSVTWTLGQFTVFAGFLYVCLVASVTGTAPSGSNASTANWAYVGKYTAAAYNSGTTYTLGQEVSYDGWVYTCAATSPVTGSAPTGGETSNANWAFVTPPTLTDHITIAGLVGGESTWEVLGATTGATTPLTTAVASGSLMEGLGVRNPSSFANDFSQNSFRVENRSGATRDTWFRSVSRQPSDITAGSAEPDPQIVIEHAIPVPQPGPGWESSIRYGTGDVVFYEGVNYVALRASTGATPPEPGSAATPEWQPLGLDSRIPLVISAETIQNVSVGTAEQYAVYPFVEWYDSWGNMLARAFARTPTPGTAGVPANYAYDSFTTGPGSSLSGRTLDAGGGSWTVEAGSWMLDGSGDAYPSASGVKSLAVTAAPLSCTQAVTLTEAPQPGVDCGLVFWYQTSSKYWHAGMSGLWYWNGATWAEAAAYPVAFAPGDRVYVVTSQAAAGSTPAVLVYRNVIGSYVSATGSGLVASVAASATPSGSQPAGGATVYSGIASEAV